MACPLGDTKAIPIRVPSERSLNVLIMAHRDRRHCDGQPSLSGNNGHGAIFGAQRSVAIAE